MEATASASSVPGSSILAGVWAGTKSVFSDMKTLLVDSTKALLAGAFLCANIIPAMPYIMLMAAAIGFLIYLVEALLGANFWILMHSHPDGHDIWGKGGAGYPILLTLLLRPTMIVCGFFLGLGFNMVFGTFINITILPSMNIPNSSGYLGNLSQFAGVIVIYSGLHLFACYKSFSLTWELPNAITRWMGVSDHQDLGEREVKETALGVSAGIGKMAAGGLSKRTKPKPDDDGDGKGGGKGGNGKPGAGGAGPTPDGGGQTDNKAADNINTSQPTTGGDKDSKGN